MTIGISSFTHLSFVIHSSFEFRRSSFRTRPLLLLPKRIQRVTDANQQHAIGHGDGAAGVAVAFEIRARQDLAVIRRNDPDVGVGVHAVDLAVSAGWAGTSDGATAA